MSTNEDVIKEFYQAFQKSDFRAMAACYSEKIEFSDPVFPSLKGAEAGKMWEMLCKRASDLEVQFSQIRCDGKQGAACWVADYTFSATGKKVHNVIQARFEFEDGKIVRHTDDFDFWKWSSMALGFKGRALGWSQLVRTKVQGQARAGLDAFMVRND